MSGKITFIALREERWQIRPVLKVHWKKLREHLILATEFEACVLFYKNENIQLHVDLHYIKKHKGDTEEKKKVNKGNTEGKKKD